eukprot:s2839_g18.t1
MNAVQRSLWKPLDMGQIGSGLSLCPSESAQDSVEQNQMLGLTVMSLPALSCPFLLTRSCWLTPSARQQHLKYLTLLDPLAILGVKGAVQRPHWLCLFSSFLAGLSSAIL